MFFSYTINLNLLNKLGLLEIHTHHHYYTNKVWGIRHTCRTPHTIFIFFEILLLSHLSKLDIEVREHIHIVDECLVCRAVGVEV